MGNLDEENPLILSKKSNEKGGYDYVLRNGIILAKIMVELPCGIVNKRETGIGATSLELKADRNSIIVLPTIQTAKSKGIGKVHYFSSEASTSGKIRTKGKRDFLQDYLKKMDGEYKKFTVVADSLPQLLLELGDNVYEEYFLLLDEIDSIQKDSTFRKRMETCMEFYKMFPKENRAVVSATIIAFSDPLFKDEGLTNFRYEKSAKGEIAFVQTKTFLESATELIIEQIGDDKLVVAINEIEAAVTIGNYLVEINQLEFKDISILCGKSQNNKDRIAKFNDSGIEENKYPSKLNFITAAYFTGYDIDESYRLIVLSNPSMNHLRLSEYEIQQIIGRCRKPHQLISIKVVYTHYVKPENKEENTIENLIQFAQREIDALKCVSSYYDYDELGQQKAEKMRSVLAGNSGFGNFNFVFKNISGAYAISYLNIDAYIEDQRVKNTVYKKSNYLVKYFKDLGYETSKEEHYSTLLIEDQDAKKEKQKRQHQKVLDFLFSNGRVTTEQIKTFLKSANSFEANMCEFYTKASQKLSKRKIKKYLLEADTRKKLLELDSAFDAFYQKKTDFIKRNILNEFPIKSVFLPEELDQKIYELLVKNLKNVEPSRYVNSKGKKLIKNYIEYKKTSKLVDGIRFVAYRIESHNPKKFPK
jgi:hypothetical protein